MLPRIASSSEVYGEATLECVKGVPVAGILGDQQAALVGQTCFHPGEAKNTYGTGCFLLMNTGTKPVHSQHGMLTTVAYRFDGQPAVYALEGSVAITGALVQWIRDNFGLIEKSSDIEVLARTVKDNGGVYFVPAFSGLYAPYWKDNARGVIVGLTRYTNKGHLARAVLEATALQTREVVEAMEKDSGILLDVLRTDGGMVSNDLLMQFQADILDRPVVRPAVQETTALGAAYAAGLAVGFFKDIDDLRARWSVDHTWKPQMESARRAGAVRVLEEGGHAVVRLAVEQGFIHEEAMASKFFGEFMGTMVLILMGNGVGGQHAAEGKQGGRHGMAGDHDGMGLRGDDGRVHGDCVRQSGRAPQSGGDAGRGGEDGGFLEPGAVRAGANAGRDGGRGAGVVAFPAALEGHAGSRREVRVLRHVAGDRQPGPEPAERGDRHVRADSGGVGDGIEGRRVRCRRGWDRTWWACWCGRSGSRWAARRGTRSIRRAIWVRGSCTRFCRFRRRARVTGAMLRCR